MSARRVFEKALTHPDLSVSSDEIMAHLAVCDLFLNDLKSAQQTSQNLAESAPDLRIARLVADEIRDIEAGRDSFSSARRNQTGGWEMPLATSRRYGVGLPVHDRMLSMELVATFQFYFDPSLRFSEKSTLVGKFLAGSKASGKGDKRAEGTLTGFEERMFANRKRHGWRPTGMLLFGPDEVYVKTDHEMVALKRSELPLDSEEPLAETLNVNAPMISWQSLWRNIFEVDSRSGITVQFGGVVRRRRGASTQLNNTTPTSAPEVQTYGDTIAAQFSTHNGMLYSIEGKPSFKRMSRSSRKQPGFAYGQNLVRSRENHLVAYDATQDGKVIWTLPREEKDGDKQQIADGLAPLGEEEPNRFLVQGGFMGSPVGYQNSIIAPVNQNGSIWIYAFDPNDEGSTIWKSHLCDEPAAGANPWSAINLSIDGNDVLVSCGLGVVFVLDAATGQIRIARRYERGGEPDGVLGNARWPGVKKLAFKGWSSDTIIPYGRQMICFSSDGLEIESIDRETGKTLWKNSFELLSRKLDYVLGVYDGVLFVAGPETIAAFDLETRKLLWGGDDLFGGDVSLGKGILTPQGIFVPAGNKILQFELLPKKLNSRQEPIRSISVDLGGDKLGNLFSDGERFWVHGGNRIYALEAKPE